MNFSVTAWARFCTLRGLSSYRENPIKSGIAEKRAGAWGRVWWVLEGTLAWSLGKRIGGVRGRRGWAATGMKWLLAQGGSLGTPLYVLAGNPSKCSQRQAENRKPYVMSCDSRLPICCSGDLQWSHYGLPDSEASLPRPCLPLPSSPFPVSSLLFSLFLCLPCLLSLSPTLLYLALVCLCACVCFILRVSKVGAWRQRGQKGREAGERGQGTVLNLLDGVHLRGLLFQPEMGESSAPSLVDCLHLLEHLREQGAHYWARKLIALWETCSAVYYTQSE